MGTRYKGFELRFLMENAAFTDDPRAEIIRILRETADRIELGVNRGKIMDINGNSIGSFGVNHKEI